MADTRKISTLDLTVPVTKPHIQWESQSYGIEDILKTHALPVLVQCNTSNCSLNLNKFNFDLTQPLLLYGHRQHDVRAVARSVVYDKTSNSFHEIGDTIIIPEQYKGWFAILRNSEDKPVPHFRFVEQLALSNCKTFLIGGSENVEAKEIKHGKEVSYVPRMLFPGDVLTKRRLVKTMTKVKTKGLIPKTKEKDERFVMCTDDQDREFLLPMEQQGVFYMISGPSSRVTMQILHMSDIIKKIPFPCLVKLVYGKVPSTPCSFTGVLSLKEELSQPVVIAATVFNLVNTLTELPVDVPLTFTVAKNSDELLWNQAYASALKFCKSTAETFARSMKTSQLFHHGQTSRSGSIKQQHITPADECPALPPRRYSPASINASADNNHVSRHDDRDLYEVVWTQNLHSPSTDCANKKAMMSMSVPLDQPAMALQSPQTSSVSASDTTSQSTPLSAPRATSQATSQPSSLSASQGTTQATPNVKENLPTTRGSSSNYESLIAITHRRSTDYERLIPNMSPEKTFTFYEGYDFEPDSDTSFSSNREPSTWMNEGNDKNISSLTRLSVSELRSEKDFLCDDLSESVDDLPLGADSSTFWPRPRSVAADSGVESDRGFLEKVGLSRLSVREVCDQLQQIGIKEKTVVSMQKECVDGRLLQTLDEAELKESFPELTNIERKKIAMFVRGWRPQ
ncbi:uncharacterized protein LOC121375826 [Gigantopelta aegis]|uniref:uncharacterized protein LOC121375826 n=1 Tax=Gigantopelta aegis TaxID=1735272 RepID=UPI001B88D8CF|nr:uncharacterized protein LOC121375826 [Gigantopelta aegis]